MPDLDHERQFNAPVIGIDEAGRGPWAGPVTVTAIWLCPSAYDALPAGIDDSKKIKPPRRAALAADYITKPLRLGELVARIRTQLRQFRASDDARFEIGNLSFVPANKMLHEIGSDRMQALTEKEATILKFLYRAFPNDVTKDELLAEVWGFQNGVTTHTLETHIYRLRQKISRLTKKQLVLTIEKGYRLAD
jgi:DNA-binding response OmpR family regulator